MADTPTNDEIKFKLDAVQHVLAETRSTLARQQTELHNISHTCADLTAFVNSHANWQERHAEQDPSPAAMTRFEAIEVMLNRHQQQIDRVREDLKLAAHPDHYAHSATPGT